MTMKWYEYRTIDAMRVALACAQQLAIRTGKHRIMVYKPLAMRLSGYIAWIDAQEQGISYDERMEQIAEENELTQKLAERLGDE